MQPQEIPAMPEYGNVPDSFFNPPDRMHLNVYHGGTLNQANRASIRLSWQ
jgi:hypothetical protein